MACPFPGMDPYIERPDIWPDFHDRFVAIACAMLNAVIRPRYVALTQERLYVVESERPIRPDVSIVPVGAEPRGANLSATALVDADLATVFEMWREDIREPFIEIIEPAARNRVVTAIEVLSPSNKQSGAGRTAYLTKREELFAARANLVEIDLLHDGEPTIRLSTEKLATLGRWHYLVAVTRHWPSRQEVYAVPLERRLPKVAIPLDADVRDVTLDVQAAFTRCWNEGPYPELLRYAGPPPVAWGEAETAWARSILDATAKGNES